MERVAYLSVGDEVVAEDIELVSRPSVVKEPTGEWDELDLAEATRLFQIRHIEQCIQRNKGQMTAVADQLGLHRPNLYRKLKQLGLERGEK
jgi:Nif-specific regulatory protein